MYTPHLCIQCTAQLPKTLYVHKARAFRYTVRARRRPICNLAPSLMTHGIPLFGNLIIANILFTYNPFYYSNARPHIPGHPFSLGHLQSVIQIWLIRAQQAKRKFAYWDKQDRQSKSKVFPNMNSVTLVLVRGPCSYVCNFFAKSRR